MSKRGLLIALILKEVSTFETSVYFYETTLRNILEGCRPHYLTKMCNAEAFC
jgi:hypothetical protein